jgi:hypothetical protein
MRTAEPQLAGIERGLSVEETIRDTNLREIVADRAAILFEDHRQSIYCRTDRLFAGLMICQWLAGIVIAAWVSPRTWAGQ